VPQPPPPAPLPQAQPQAQPPAVYYPQAPTVIYQQPGTIVYPAPVYPPPTVVYAPAYPPSVIWGTAAIGAASRIVSAALIGGYRYPRVYYAPVRPFAFRGWRR
jgi:hypothetical protein